MTKKMANMCRVYIGFSELRPQCNNGVKCCGKYEYCKDILRGKDKKEK